MSLRDLATLTADDFEAVGDEPLTLHAGADTLALTVASVTRIPRAGEGRQPFSVLFHGPATPMAPQATYRLEGATFGAAELFLVPLGPVGGAMRYEAVFT